MKELKKARNFSVKILCALFSMLIAFVSLSVCAYANETYVSEVAIATGTNGRTSLENKGYTVLFQSLNLISNEDSMVFLGYKMGTSAITDFIVSTQKSSSLTYNKSTYTLVSSVSLNNGTEGTPIYLYSTKDSSAGDKISSLDTVSGFSDTDEIISLRNDGSSPVRMSDGSLANFDKGVDNSEIYLLMYRESSIKQYISNACIVTGNSKTDVINSIASKGCDYYLDYDLTLGNKISYIGYQRSADKNDAITEITVDGTDLIFSKAKDSTSYLLDISSDKLFDDTFALGDWAGVYAATDKTISKTSKEYKALKNSKESCTCVSAGNSKIYAFYLGKVTELVETTTVTTTENSTEAVTEMDNNTSIEESITEESDLTETEISESDVSEDLTDEFYDIDKSETSESETEESDGESVGSVFSKGSGKIILCLAIILILILIGTAFYMKARDKKNEKDN